MDSLDLKTRLSVNIKRLRKEKKWSQFELAEKADVSEQTINSIESKRLWPSDKTLVKITGALEIDVVQLFFPDSENALSKLEIQGDLSNIVVSSVRSLVEETLKQYTKI